MGHGSGRIPRWRRTRRPRPAAWPHDRTGPHHPVPRVAGRAPEPGRPGWSGAAGQPARRYAGCRRAWPGLAAIGQVVRLREAGAKISTGTACGLLSARSAPSTSARLPGRTGTSRMDRIGCSTRPWTRIRPDAAGTRRRRTTACCAPRPRSGQAGRLEGAHERKAQTGRMERRLPEGATRRVQHGSNAMAPAGRATLRARQASTGAKPRR